MLFVLPLRGLLWFVVGLGGSQSFGVFEIVYVLLFLLCRFLGLLPLGCVSVRDFVGVGVRISDWELRKKVLGYVFWCLYRCKLSEFSGGCSLGCRFRELYKGGSNMDPHGSVRVSWAAFVVGVLPLVIDVVAVVVVGDGWGSKKNLPSFSFMFLLYLVMASPAIAVNQILKEAPRLQLREASSSSVVRHFPFQGMPGVELQGNVTLGQRSQEVGYLCRPWDDLFGERCQFSLCAARRSVMMV